MNKEELQNLYSDLSWSAGYLESLLHLCCESNDVSEFVSHEHFDKIHKSIIDANILIKTFLYSKEKNPKRDSFGIEVKDSELAV